MKEWVAGRAFAPERPLIDLCQAVPDFPPAPELIAYLKPLLDDPQLSRYSPDEGLYEARAAVAAWLARRYGLNLDPATQVLPVNGSREALFALAQTVIDPTKPGAPGKDRWAEELELTLAAADVEFLKEVQAFCLAEGLGAERAAQLPGEAGEGAGPLRAERRRDPEPLAGDDRARRGVFGPPR